MEKQLGATADPLGSLGVLSPCAAGGGGVTAVTVPKRRKPNYEENRNRPCIDGFFRFPNGPYIDG